MVQEVSCLTGYLCCSVVGSPPTSLFGSPLSSWRTYGRRRHKRGWTRWMDALARKDARDVVSPPSLPPEFRLHELRVGRWVGRCVYYSARGQRRLCQCNDAVVVGPRCTLATHSAAAVTRPALQMLQMERSVTQQDLSISSSSVLPGSKEGRGKFWLEVVPRILCVLSSSSHIGMATFFSS